MERAFPAGHFDLAAGQLRLGDALTASGRADEGRTLLESALDWRVHHLGATDPRTVAARESFVAASMSASGTAFRNRE